MLWNIFDIFSFIRVVNIRGSIELTEFLHGKILFYESHVKNVKNYLLYVQYEELWEHTDHDSCYKIAKIKTLNKVGIVIRFYNWE